jgi:hypothetical protein
LHSSAKAERIVPMNLNLARLREMHPRLPEDLALILLVRAGLGLQRNGHASPVGVSLEIERVAVRGQLAWEASEMEMIGRHDHHRITEDGAEAVALALVHQDRGWRIVRRLQREEHADWLLEETGEAAGQLVALEVSGVDRGSLAARMGEKLAQVSRSVDVDQRWAAVVGFEEPSAALRSTEAAGL